MKTAYSRIIVLLFLFSILLGLSAQSAPQRVFGFDPAKLPLALSDGIISGALAKDDTAWIRGFIGRDFSKHDFSKVTKTYLLRQAFDSDTKFPQADKLPEGYQPREIMELCKNPGLGIRRLHNNGISGKGVVVAIIDKPILYPHSKSHRRMTYHVVFPQDPRSSTYHFHGMACASILAGSTTGVAPEAGIHYFSVPDNGRNYQNYLAAIKMLIEVNEELEKGEKIRIVSVSDGGPDFKSREWKTAVKNLQKEGIEIVYSGGEALDGFSWGGCSPFLDRENPANYRSSLFFDGNFCNPRILVPSDYRTTGSNSGEEDYVYRGVGGWSWAIPYMAGLSALAWQIDPGLKYKDIEKGLRRTAIVNAHGERVLDPSAYIGSLSLKRK